MFKQALILGLPALSMGFSSALAGEVHVMSGQPVEAGLVAAANAFRRQTGNDVKITYATTPQMRERLAAGETPDVVIAPPALLDELIKAGKIDGTARVAVGRVGVGVAVRRGAPKPDISTVDALKRALLDADTVIYNRASSGLYVEELVQRLGVADRIQAKSKRYPGIEMVDALVNGSGKEIGFMPVAEIVHLHERGMDLVGPLPAEVQNYTSYSAAPMAKAQAAADFVAFLATPAAKQMFAKAGID